MNPIPTAQQFSRSSQRVSGQVVQTFKTQSSACYRGWLLMPSSKTKVVHMMLYFRGRTLIVAAFFMIACASHESRACTGIALKAKDGAWVYGRTMEWGTFDLKSRLVIVPRGYNFTGHTPDGKPGITWQGTHGVVGLDAVEKDMIVDGMNEKGLTVGLFYHPGYAVYQKYDPARTAESMSPTDVGQYLLSLCATVDEVRTAMTKVCVVPVIEPALVFSPPVHYLVTEPSGKAIVIEFLYGELKIFDAPLGVITNCAELRLARDQHTELRQSIAGCHPG